MAGTQGRLQLHSNATGIRFDQPPPETVFLRLGLEPMGLGLELLQEGDPLDWRAGPCLTLEMNCPRPMS